MKKLLCLTLSLGFMTLGFSQQAKEKSALQSMVDTELVTNKSGILAEKIIVACIGGVGAILTNFIAAIYLRMHSTASESLNVFHSKLVESQELLLSNLLASGIEDDQKRWDTLAEISKNIVRRNEKTD